MSGILGGIEQWATDVVDSLGYIGVAGLVALETVVPPIPSEVILPLAGSLVAEDRFNFPLVVIAATIGSLIGSLLLYGVAYWIGPLRLRRIVARTGRFVLVDLEDVDRAQQQFDRYGGLAVMFGRLVPGVRSLISLPAGLVRMAPGRFIVYTAIGSAVWNGTLVGIGWGLADQWYRVGDYAPILEYVVIAAGAVAIIWFVTTRLLHRRRVANALAGARDTTLPSG